MANFKIALDLVFAHEGTYVNDPSDTGGETYKGVARSVWPKLALWKLVDVMKNYATFPTNLDTNPGIQQSIENFYETEYWNKIRGNEITNQDIANSIFDFAVNSGVVTSIILAQNAVGTTPDGIIGHNTLDLFNTYDKSNFIIAFTLLKIVRYVHIVKKRPESRKYFYGWVCRSIGEN